MGKSGLRCALVVIPAMLLLAGCHTIQVPDPNDPMDASPAQLAGVLQLNIKQMADSLNDRVGSGPGQITDQQRLDFLSDEAKHLLSLGDPAHARPQDAWIYANLYITSDQFDKAIPLLKEAIAYAASVNDDDRRVNDSLRLARALAKTGHVAESLNLVQSVIDSKPKDPGPVLPSVLLEITPLTEGKGHDEQLAKLLEESIHEHLRVVVDPKTLPGQSFLMAKPHHIENAWYKIVTLLQSSGHPAQAKAAQVRSEQMMQTLQPAATL